MKLFISMMFLMALFSGCAKPQPTIVYIPALGSIATTEIGQNMYQKINAYFPKWDGVEFVTKNEVTAKLEKRHNGHLYLRKRDDIGCELLDRYGSLLMIDENCDGSFDKRAVVFSSDDDKRIVYKTVPPKPTSISSDSFMYGVLYQGKVDNKLNIAFQEYVGEGNKFMIRPAYTQNIQYELDENGEAEIGFRGLRIKVLKATNFEITYKVMKDFD